MDFHAALETFAEAWVAANTQTAVNSEPGSIKHTSLDELPTMLPKDQLSTTQEIQDSVCNKINHGNDVGGQRSKCNTPSNQMPPIEKSSSCTPSPAIVSSSLSQKTASLKSPNHKKPELIQTQSGTRSLPIHCVIEQMHGAVNFDNATSAPCDMCAVELDSYAILPATTPLHELVRTALTKLGYSSADAVNAKGAIQLKNWKPLSFDIITDDKTTTVDDILGELINSATLRIRLSSETIEQQWTDNSVHCAVLSLLKHRSQSALAKLSPLSQSTISNIANGKYHNRLSREKCQEFGIWYTRFIRQSDYTTPISQPRDTRMTFHPDHELPLLRTWYKSNKNPSNEKFTLFANELNKGHVRQDRPKVTVEKLKMWWKNEKQREKRSLSIPVPCANDNLDSEQKLLVTESEKGCIMQGSVGVSLEAPGLENTEQQLDNKSEVAVKSSVLTKEKRHHRKNVVEHEHDNSPSEAKLWMLERREHKRQRLDMIMSGINCLQQSGTPEQQFSIKLSDPQIFPNIIQREKFKFDRESHSHLQYDKNDKGQNLLCDEKQASTSKSQGNEQLLDQETSFTSSPPSIGMDFADLL